MTVTHMMGLLARPAMETRNRQGDGAKARAGERTDAGGSGGAATGRAAASLDTAPVMARRGLVGTARMGWGWFAHGGCCEVLELRLGR